MVRIFRHSDWIQRDTEYLSVFSSNAGKYGPEKTPYLDTFYAVYTNRESRGNHESITVMIKVSDWNYHSKNNVLGKVFLDWIYLLLFVYLFSSKWLVLLFTISYN